MRSSRRRRWALALVAISALALSGAATWPVVSGRTAPPRFTLDSAKRALADARQSGAAKWAPGSLETAEGAFRTALTEHRRQEVRFLLFRDFAEARADLRLAEAKARLAVLEAQRRREEARDVAGQAIAEAEEAMTTTEAFSRALHLGTYARTLLQRAKIALAEARILYDQEEYLTASERAQQAGTQAAGVTEKAASKVARFADPGRVRAWRSWIDETVSWSRKTGEPAIVVIKEHHKLVLYRGGRPVRSYRAELGYNSANDKLHAGDAATPEGRYRITARKDLGRSTYHRALLLSYPNEEDLARFRQARSAGRVSRRASVGGLIEIHGEGGQGKDWTRGCVALANGDIDDLFARVQVGTPVTIVGGDGNGGTFTNLVKLHRKETGAGVQ